MSKSDAQLQLTFFALGLVDLGRGQLADVSTIVPRPSLGETYRVVAPAHNPEKRPKKAFKTSQVVKALTQNCSGCNVVKNDVFSPIPSWAFTVMANCPRPTSLVDPFKRKEECDTKTSELLPEPNLQPGA
jgi:hypothetical protein